MMPTTYQRPSNSERTLAAVGSYWQHDQWERMLVVSCSTVRLTADGLCLVGVRQVCPVSYNLWGMNDK